MPFIRHSIIFFHFDEFTAIKQACLDNELEFLDFELLWSVNTSNPHFHGLHGIQFMTDFGFMDMFILASTCDLNFFVSSRFV